jgi:RNA polymerase sigma-70 factor (ECF subfamily)
MAGDDRLTERFEAERSRLLAVAYRMLGSSTDAEDAVQEAWLRLNRADTSEIVNLGGWLTTVVSRLALDSLRSRGSRVEQASDLELSNEEPASQNQVGPEEEAILVESVGLAMLVVLDRLDPAERVAFVLHDMFAVSFDEVASILERSPAAARQLASRARRRVQGADVPEGRPSRHGEIVDAFFAASRRGEFEALLSLLDPQVVLRADPVAVAMAASRRAQGAPMLAAEVHGARAVAETFLGKAGAARLALIGGRLGATWAPSGKPRVVFCFTTQLDRITEIKLVADPESISDLQVAVLGRHLPGGEPGES